MNRHVHMKKQGKRSKKKPAFRMIIYKQDMCRVYRHAGKDSDYEVQQGGTKRSNK